MTSLLSRRRRRLTLCAGLGVVVAASCVVASSSAGAQPTSRDRTVLATALSGLDTGRLTAVAAKNGISVAHLRQLAADPTSHLDATDRIYVVDPPASAASIAASRETTEPLASPRAAADAFTLHSRPGSRRTLYLDFTGGVVSGTAWNDSTGIPSATIHPFDTDGDPSTFSDGEAAIVQSVWQRVSEDYISRDVDVTTQEPAPSRITRSSSSDQLYGTRVMVSPDDFYYSGCSCGGIAYVGVFDASGSSHDYYQPAFIFTKGLGSDPKNLAEAASHEAGHNLGLSHDGTSQTGYYTGQGPWAPIMGVGYYHPVSQWSKGEYADANNTEDDFAVMASHGAATVKDDYGNTPATAAAWNGQSLQGLITTRSDVDHFSYSHPGGTFAVTATSGFGVSVADLDIALVVKDANGTVVARANPATVQQSRDDAEGMGASISRTLPAGTYDIALSGVGYGDPLTTGYSDYASVGRYTLSLG